MPPKERGRGVCCVTSQEWLQSRLHQKCFCNGTCLGVFYSDPWSWMKNTSGQLAPQHSVRLPLETMHNYVQNLLVNTLTVPVTLSSCSSYLCVDRLPKPGLDYQYFPFYQIDLPDDLLYIIFQLNRSNQKEELPLPFCFVFQHFLVLEKSQNKFECLTYKMLILEECKPSLNVQADSLCAKLVDI